MTISTKQIDRSRLGRLLVNRGYISDVQLEQALQRQRDTGQKLGEVLVAQGWVSARTINRTLRHQKRYRYAAAFAAIVAAPLQPMIAFAASAPAAASPVPETRAPAGFQPMSDEQMSGVSARGLDQYVNQIKDVQNMANGTKKPDSIEALKMVAKTFFPVFAALDYNMTITGVHYDPNRPKYQLLADGGLEMALPDQIKQVSMQNIHVGNSPSMGTLTFNNVRFYGDSHITVRVNP